MMVLIPRSFMTRVGKVTFSIECPSKKLFVQLLTLFTGRGSGCSLYAANHHHNGGILLAEEAKDKFTGMTDNCGAG